MGLVVPVMMDPATGSLRNPQSGEFIDVEKGGTGANTPAGARAALGLEKFTSVGDAAYTILATDRTVGLTAALTAGRTWTLPAANSVNAGGSLRIVDTAGGVSPTNKLTITAAGSDTLNGASSSAFSAPFTDFQIVSDGVSKWTYDVQGVVRGGTGNTTGDVGNLNFTGRGPNIMSLTKRLADRVDIREWSSVDLTGNNANDNIVQAWLTQAMQSGLPAYAPPGLCMLNTGTSITMTSDLEVSLPRKFILKSTASCANPLVNLNAPQRDKYSLRWKGGQFINTLGVYNGAGQFNTCLGTSRIFRMDVDDVWFIGASDLTTAFTTTDSAITFGDSRQVNIRNNWFIGQGDCGIYGSGNNDNTTSSDDGGAHILMGNYFKWCGNAINVKRQAPRTLIVGNIAEQCLYGFCNWESLTQEPGRQTSVIANTLKQIRNVAIDLRYCTGGKISQNYIEDFGCMDDGVTVSDLAIGIRLHGVDNVDCSDNDIIMADWTTTTSHTAYSIDGMTLNGVTKVGQNNVVNGGRIKGVYTGVSEGNNTAANSYDNIGMQGVTVPYTTSVYTNQSNIRHPVSNGWSIGNSSTGAGVAGIQFGRDGIFNVRRGSTPIVSVLLANAGTFVRCQTNNPNAGTDVGALAYGTYGGNANSMVVSGAGANTNAGLAPTGTGVGFSAAPFQLPGYTFATLPSATTYSGCSVRVTDRNSRVAQSDGTNWRYGDNSVAA